MKQPLEQQEATQEQKSEVEKEIDDIKNAISKLDETTISKIEKDIEKSNQDIEKANNETSELADQITTDDDKNCLTDKQEEGIKNATSQSLASLPAERRAVHGVERLLDNERLLTKKFKTGFLESGLLHVQDTFRLQFRDCGPINIGLIEKDTDNKKPHKRALRLRNDIEAWEPCQELIDAWPIVDLDTASPEFLQGLVAKLQFLDGELMRMAVYSLNGTYKLGAITSIGRTTLRIFVYAPFASLFVAAATGGLLKEDFKAGQGVSVSRSVLCKAQEEDSHGVSKKITIIPDAAVTLGQGWDVFGIMILKPGKACNQQQHLHDIHNCSLMTAASAIVFSQCIDENRHNEIAIPFLVGTGSTCSLYVTTMCNGIPSIRVVTCPFESDGQDFDLSTGNGRTKCFVVLAFLLNNFKGLIDDKALALYKRDLEQRRPDMQSEC